MTEASTQNLKFNVKIACFHNISDELRQKIHFEVFELIKSIGKENEFIVFSSQIDY